MQRHKARTDPPYCDNALVSSGLFIHQFLSSCSHFCDSFSLPASDECSACLFYTGNGTELIVPDGSYKEIISEWLRYF